VVQYHRAMNLKIRDAVLDDAQAIAHNNAAMALETEQKLLDAATVRLGVQACFSDPGKGSYFVAENEAGAIVGQLMITHEWSDWRNGDFWWIQSVYVPPSARRAGVFRALYAHIEKLACSTPGVCGIRLYVESENTRAQRTYEHCGMRNAGYCVMEVDYSGATHRAKA
jgi:ribosomal protein S18 acetylase RimI-like enzyme